MLPQKRSNFDSFSTYMNDKENKLRAQFTSNIQVKSQLLMGVCVHVNGRTEPPIEVLRQMVLEHGGAFEQYYHSHKVTHVLCTHIPRAKELNAAKEFKSKLIKPEWIVESIRLGRKLPETSFKLYNDCNGLMDKFVKRVEIAEGEVEGEGSDIEEGIEDEGIHEEDDDIDLLADMIDSLEETDEPEIDEKEIDEKEVDEKESIVTKVSSNTLTTNHNTNANTRTSENESFLNDFYQNSRLHHLSLWRSEASSLCRKLMQSKSPKEVPTAASPVYMHVDLDCFFVQVSAMKYCPQVDFSATPLAVTHSSSANSKSTSDISSCNYAARAFGIRNGMYVKEAVERCPQLQVIPYDFEGYQRVMTKFYGCLANWALEMESVSCDEAYITISTANEEESSMIAECIRADIKEKCEVDASIGAGPSMLCARMATRLAKPAGQFLVKREEAAQFMAGQEISQLPGIGRALMEKISQAWPGVKLCGELGERAGLLELQSKLGAKIGLRLARALQGEDNRQLKSERKRQSVGSEVSWGVRFASVGQMKRFVDELSEEVWRRLQGELEEGDEDGGDDVSIGELGESEIQANSNYNNNNISNSNYKSKNAQTPFPRKIAIKLYKRRPGAGEPKKYLGRGICDVFHRSKSLNKGLQKCSQLQSEVWALIEVLMKSSSIAVKDVRGVGVFLSDFGDDSKRDGKGHVDVLDAMTFTRNADAIDAMISASNVDPEVWAALPEDIRAELSNGMRVGMRFDSNGNSNGNSNGTSNGSCNGSSNGNSNNISNTTNNTSNTIASNNSTNANRKNKGNGKKSKDNTLTLTQLWGQRVDREDSELKRRLAALPESEYDRQVLLALPRELQLEIVSEYEGRVARSMIKPSESTINPTEEMDSKTPITVTDRLPIEFADRADWTPFEWYYFLKNNLQTLDISALETVLKELCLQAGGLKVVRDSCCMIKQSLPNGDAIVDRILELVYQLYGSHLRID